MPLEILKVHFDCAGSLNLGGRGGCFYDCALVVAPCVFSHTAVTFPGRRKGNLVLLRTARFVAGAALCMDVVVIVEELRFRDRCSES